MAETPAHSHEMEDHMHTYRAFQKGVVMVILMCMFTVVALCSFAFGKTLPVLLGWATLIFGILVILIDARSGGKSWLLSIGTLLVFGLITAASV